MYKYTLMPTPFTITQSPIVFTCSKAVSGLGLDRLGLPNGYRRWSPTGRDGVSGASNEATFLQEEVVQQRGGDP